MSNSNVIVEIIIFLSFLAEKYGAGGLVNQAAGALGLGGQGGSGASSYGAAPGGNSQGGM